MILAPFKELIREHCGLSFEEGREARLVEGIRTRVAERRLASSEEYLGVLAREPGEMRKLVSRITVNETYFLREAAQFRLLAQLLLPEIGGGREAAGPVKIVSVGCSTGEEPYSIALTLCERFGPELARRCAVFGCDIDEEALAAARRGSYSGHSFRGVPVEIRERYFEREGDRHRIVASLRNAVTFLRINVCEDGFPESLRGADVIFYRNVSIYFEPAVQQRIFRNLAGLLRDGGHLFLSATETYFHNVGVLSLIERDGIYLYRKGLDVGIEDRRRGQEAAAVGAAPPVARPAARRDAPERRARLAPEDAGAQPPARPPERGEDGAGEIFDAALRCAEAKRYDEALALVGRSLGLRPGFAQAHLLKAGILVNARRFEEAEAACRRSLELDRWSLEGYLFLGMIAKMRGAFDEAQRRFAEALYVKPSCWIAHFHLAEIFRQTGDAARAGREYGIVIDLVTAQGDAGPGTTFFSFAVSAEQVAHLCRRNLAALGGGRP